MDYATAADVLPHDLARVAADFAARFQALEQQLVSFQPVARALIALLAKSPAALPNSDLHAVYATPSLLPSSDDYASLAVQTNHASAAYSRRPSVLLQMPNTMKSLALNTEVSLEDIREEWVKDAKTASVLDVAMAAADANDSDPQDASGFSIRGGSSGGGGFELESARSMSKFHLARSAFAIKFPTSTSELHNFRSSDNDISGKKSAEVLPRHKMPKRIKELKLSSSGSIGLPDPESPANVVEDGAEETNQKSVVSVSKQLLHTLSRKASQKSVAEIKQQKQHSVSQIAASKQKSKLQKIFDQGLRENSNIVINADLAFSGECFKKKKNHKTNATITTVIYTTELWLIPVSICFKFDLTVYYSILVSLQNLADCTFEFITLRSSHPAMCAESTIQDWREHYVRNRLAVDIIAIIPFELIPVANSEYFWLLKLLKMYKLVRIVEYSPVYVRIRNDFLKATKIGHAGSLMFPVLFWFCLFLHFQSCVIFLVASLFGFVNEESAPYRDAPIWDQYIWALFTSTANFFPLGYHPKNYQEQLVTLFFVICSAGLFACIVGVISSIAVGFDPSGRMYKQKTDELIEYMRWKQLDNRMQEKVLNYFKLKYRGKYFQERALN
ncbi:hypothetical protein HDU83_006622 [Entophlyctis luteolus]|nr:hypothetical protein HDU83_006622 [Entophlyctis luteolus]